MKPNIIMLVLDAVRAQNLPQYGYLRNTTPFLTSIEDELAVYENAISSTYWTMPSIASLFTGMYKSGHGLVSDGDRIDGSLITLPSLLQQHGYRCAGFVRNVYVSEYSGLNTGFDDFYSTSRLDVYKKIIAAISKRGLASIQPPGITRQADVPLGGRSSVKKHISEIIARLADVTIDSGSKYFVHNFSGWLREQRNRPFFAFFQFLETHSPYRAPLNFAFKFMSLRDNMKRLDINQDHLRYLLGESPMNEEDFRILQDAYDNSILYADYLISKIINLLKKYNLYDNTMIIILSDHGDNIGDHGLMFHYFCLYDTLIKIPVIIKYPAVLRLTGRLPEIVQNVDIFPSILSILKSDHKKAWDQVEGNDFFANAVRRREDDLAVSELVKVFGPDKKQYKDRLSRFNRRLLSVRTRDRKFIYSSRGDHEYYNLKKDPSESNNLYAKTDAYHDLMEKAAGYYERMDQFYSVNRNKIDGEISDNNIDGEVMERLKALGYV